MTTFKRGFSNRAFPIALAVAGALALGACSAKHRGDESGIVQSGTIEEATIEQTARVGTMDVGPEVRNFDQIDPGDTIRAILYQSAVFDVRVPDGSIPGVVAAAGADRAAEGDKPGAIGTRTITVSATITAIDRNPDMVTLRGPEGETRRIPVRNPAHLENVEVGDVLDITFTVALAIFVEETPAS
jgi:hypothetical protein